MNPDGPVGFIDADVIGSRILASMVRLVLQMIFPHAIFDNLACHDVFDPESCSISTISVSHSSLYTRYTQTTDVDTVRSDVA